MSPMLLANQKVLEQDHVKAINVVNSDIIDHHRMLFKHKHFPAIDSTVDAKLRWLRSQIIGGNAEIHTPFGKRKLTYADHTATGQCLHYIEDYIIKTLLPFYGNTHTSDSYVGDWTMKTLHESQDFIKKCLGGTQDDALIFCGSGTTAAIKRLQEVMGIAIPSVLRERILKSCIKSEERWVVFVGPYEHHSNLLSWRQSLAEVIEIGLNNEGFINMHDLESQLTLYQETKRPMLGSFSACSNVTGVYSDTRSLSRLLHKYGAFACFDFAASGPYVEIDMRSGDVDGYDAIALSPHKFLGGPGSPGILLMSKALYKLKNSPPSTCGGGTVNFVNCFNEKDTLYVRDIEEREDAGTPQIIQRVKAALTFQLKEYISCDVIAKKERNHIKRALERLVKNPNISVLGNTKVERQPILSFLVYTTTCSLDVELRTCNKRGKPLNGAFVAKLLNDLFGIQARGGCACAGPYAHCLLGIDEPHSRAIKSAVEMGYNGARLGWTRVSLPYYMSNEECEFIVAAIEIVATYGQRFLSLYHFNWTTGSWSFKTHTYEEILVLEKNSNPCISVSANPPDALQVKRTKSKTRTNEDHFDTYTFYLELANQIGKLLPEFPSECKVPKGIDADRVFYQV